MYVYPQCETDLGQRSEVGSWSEEFRTVQYITCIHDYERKVKQENVSDKQYTLYIFVFDHVDEFDILFSKELTC